MGVDRLKGKAKDLRDAEHDIHDIRDEKRRPSSVQPERNPKSPGNDVVPERDDDIGEEVA